MSRAITKEIIINETKEKIFEALIKPSVIKKWWGAKNAIVIPELNGLHAVCWGEDEDHPAYTTAARISEFKRPAKLSLTDFKYTSKAGRLPFQAKLEVEFIIESFGDKTKLVVKQTGFPEDAIADDYFTACTKGWENTLALFKIVVEVAG